MASGGGTGRTLHPDNVAAGPHASYGLTDLWAASMAMLSLLGSSSVPAHVEMMGLIGMGNNPIVRPHGEVSVVGVPWKPYTDITAYSLLHPIFYNYVRVYSGWENDLPLENSKFVHESMNKNYRLAMKLIHEGKLIRNDLYTIKPYTEAQQAYEDILDKKEKTLATIFSWDIKNMGRRP